MKISFFFAYQKLLLLTISCLFTTTIFSQRDMVDFLLETEVISNYKEAKNNIEEILSSQIDFSHLTKSDYLQLKSEYLKVQTQFNAFISIISDDLKSKETLSAMSKSPIDYLTKYETAFNNAASTLDNGFMPVYSRLLYGEQAKSIIIGGLTATFTDVLTDILIKVGTKIAVNIIVKKFTQPLLLPEWDKLVKEPATFSERFEHGIVTEQPIIENQNIDTGEEIVSKPILKKIEGEVMFVDKNKTPIPFSWKNRQNIDKALAATGSVNEIVTAQGGDYFISEDAIPEQFFFQSKVKTDAIFYLFAFNQSKNEIISAYPLPISKSLHSTTENYTETYIVDNTSDGFITLPMKDINPSKENYWYTTGNDVYEDIVVLVSNSKFDHRNIYQQIANESGDINIRIEKVFNNNDIVLNNIFTVSEEKNNSIHFSSDTDQSSILPLIFVLKRQ